jgi:2'-deoxynucleoside 5'-phosphate N-hydrolase
MKIYFAGSIRGGRDDGELYGRIISFLKKYGTVLSEHVGDPNLSLYGETKTSDVDIYERDVAWVEECDMMIAEVTTPSLGVGYEIGRAEALGKPILCLFRNENSERRLSAMISGNKNLKVFAYQTEDEIKDVLERFIPA